MLKICQWHQLRSVGLVLLSFYFISCQSGPTQAPKDPRIIPPSSQVQENPTPVLGKEESVTVPDFVGQRAPRVGLIFGPGGAKTFAQIGVLQELEKYKIPVVAVAGLEWGAVIGALYATHGQSHEVDWKMSQIPKFSFSSKNLFSKKMRAANTKEFDQYLQKVFQDNKMENTKMPFACPFIRGASGRVALATKGVAKNSLRSCWYYPPIFDLSETMAAPFSLAESVDFLKNQGAELILLINVVESVDKKEFSNWSEEEWSWFSWVPVQNVLKNAKAMGVHEVISIDTSTYMMSDLDQRLRLIQLGKQGSAGLVERIVRKYDF